MKHTLEPWIVETFNTSFADTGDVDGHIILRTPNGGKYIAEAVDPDDEDEANFRHIAELHNACAGINPEGIAGAVAQAQRIFTAIMAECLSAKNCADPINDSPGWSREYHMNITLTVGEIQDLHQALAALKPTTKEV